MRIIALGGLSGSGKSTVAAALAPHLDAVILSTDRIRKERLGIPFEQPAPPEAYREEAVAAVYRSLTARAMELLAQGRTIIIDAVNARHSERAAHARMAENPSPPTGFRGYWLDVPTAVRQSRIDTRPVGASDATAEITLRQERFLERPILWTVLPTGIDEAVRFILADLGRDRA